MSNIYSAKFMHEASTTLESKVFKRPINETYLFSSINALREMNNIIDEKTKKLYIQISEAESKEEENKLFAEYFYQFKSVFEEYSNRLQQMKSRMVIAIENKVETWEDLYKDDTYISCFDKQFSYSGYNFHHVNEDDYPRLNLYKLYNKEFDYIGQLMQDTSMSASPSARLKIIATVCNNFAKTSGDKNWIKDLVRDMVDVDEKEITRSYSECIYNALRDKYYINVDKGMLYTCKEALCDYEDVIDAASDLCDDLLHDLEKVAENVSSFLFRNQDNKLKIKTDTDGIIDRDYRLDTYSMNQLDLFMKNKINQIKKLLNVYSVAIGIKFDTAVDYIDQNIEILKMAKTYDSNKEAEDTEEPNPDTEPTDDGEDTGVEEPETSDEPEMPEDGNDDDFEFGNDDSDEGEEPIEEEPEDDDFGNFGDDEEPEMGNDVMDGESGDFEEAYLFESELFELEMMCNEYEMHQAITEALLLEADEAKKEEPQEQPKTSELRKIANKAKDPNFFQKIIAKIKELWEKFRKKFFDKTKEQVDFIRKNQKYLDTQITGTAKIKYLPNFDLFEKITIPDLNYSSMQKQLESEENFCKQYFNDIYEEGRSIADVMKEKVLREEEAVKFMESQPLADNGEKDIKEITKALSITKARDFCLGYEKLMNKLNSQMNLLNKAEKVARDISKVPDTAPAKPEEKPADNNTQNNAQGQNPQPQNAATYFDDYHYYFNEFSGSSTEENSEKRDGLKLYFNVCTRVIAAEMTVANLLFSEMYGYCSWWIMRAKGGNVNNTENPADNGSSGTPNNPATSQN